MSGVEVKVSKSVKIEGDVLTLRDLQDFLGSAIEAGFNQDDRLWVSHTDSQRDGGWTKIQVGT